MENIFEKSTRIWSHEYFFFVDIPMTLHFTHSCPWRSTRPKRVTSRMSFRTFDFTRCRSAVVAAPTFATIQRGSRSWNS